MTDGDDDSPVSGAQCRLSVRWTITFGTATTTLSGQIAAPGSLIPSGSVSITLGGVTATAAIDPATGDFSSVFNNCCAGVAVSPYTVTHSSCAAVQRLPA